MACAVLAASEAIPAAHLSDLVLIGELGLDGRIRPVPGVLPAAAAAAAAGFGSIVVAAGNAAEAPLVPELTVISAPSLAAFTTWLRSGMPPEDVAVTVLEPGRDAEAVFACHLAGDGLGASTVDAVAAPTAAGAAS
jgi:magnesium chelatase family protein